MKMSAVPTLEDLQYSLDAARKVLRQPVFLAWLAKTEVRVLSIVCGLDPTTDEAVWVLRTGEKLDSPIIWRHLTSDVHLIHAVIMDEIQGAAAPAAVIPDFLKPKNAERVVGNAANGNSPVAAPPPPPPGEEEIMETEPPGTVFADRYEIVEEVGRGAMGIVYKARQRVTDRFVALKILQAHLLKKEINKKRFEYEAKAAGGLSHPNLIHIYDFGTSPIGRPYIVMDYVEGPSLQDVLSHEGFLDVASMVEIFCQVCRGLNHAHKRGIVHRDLKPSNIKLTDGDNNTVIVKVLDFGIAKLTKATSIDEQQLTRQGDIIGSPLYMSPEQCKGEELDARSDIYSLGCMMYQTVTGALPFVGKDPFETMYKHIYEKAPRFEDIRPDLVVPAELQRIIFKTLEIDVAKRYNSVEEIDGDLSRLRASGQQIASTHENPVAPDVPNLQLSSTTQSGISIAQLLRQSGVVANNDLDQVLKLTAEVGGDVGKILVATGKVSPVILEAAIKCRKLIEKKMCNLSQAVILLGYCNRKQLSFDDASKELGWEFGDVGAG